MIRNRELIERALPIGGTIIIFGALLLLGTNLHVQIIAVLIGLLLVEAGTFRITQRALPDDRRYTSLRAEVDDFIRLVRRLNDAAVARDRDPAAAAEFEAVQLEMEEAIGRMADTAGVEEDRPATRTPARR